MAQRGGPLIHRDDSIGCAFQSLKRETVFLFLVSGSCYLIGTLVPPNLSVYLLGMIVGCRSWLKGRVGRRKLGNMVTLIVAYSRKTPTTPLTTPWDADVVIY